MPPKKAPWISKSVPIITTKAKQNKVASENNLKKKEVQSQRWWWFARDTEVNKKVDIFSSQKTLLRQQVLFVISLLVLNVTELKQLMSGKRKTPKPLEYWNHMNIFLVVIIAISVLLH